MFKVNCPYCKSDSISDVCDKIEDSDGVWECANGHRFKLNLLGHFPPTSEDIKYYIEHGGKIVKCPICEEEFDGCIHYKDDLIDEIQRQKDLWIGMPEKLAEIFKKNKLACEENNKLKKEVKRLNAVLDWEFYVGIGNFKFRLHPSDHDTENYRIFSEHLADLDNHRKYEENLRTQRAELREEVKQLKKRLQPQKVSKEERDKRFERFNEENDGIDTI